MAANIHTTSTNAVTLVWGSLRLAPINCPLSHFVASTNNEGNGKTSEMIQELNHLLSKEPKVTKSRSNKHF